MKTRHNSRRHASEIEVYEKIRTGFNGECQKLPLQEIARDVFLTHFPGSGSLTTEGVRVARSIFCGGLLAAEELGLSVEMAVHQLAQGLLSGICESRDDFLTGAWVVVHAAIGSVLRTPADLSRATESVIDVVLTAGRENVCYMEYLTRLVTRAAVEASGSFPEEETASMEWMLLGLLDMSPRKAAVGSDIQRG